MSSLSDHTEDHGYTESAEPPEHDRRHEDRRSAARRVSDRAGETVDSTYRYRVYMYAALWLGMVFLFWRIEGNQDEMQEDNRRIIEAVDREAATRDYFVCLRGNELRNSILNFVMSIQDEFGPSDTVNELVRQAGEDFAAVNCREPR